MDFAISNKMKTVLDMIHTFLEKEVYPLEPSFFRKEFKELLPELQALRNKVKQMGLWGPNYPEELGGMGLNLVEHGLVSEALGRSPLGHYLFGCQAPDAGNIEILHMFGTEEQKEKYLKPLIKGDIRSCFAMTEVNTAGSNPLLMEATAVKDGDEYVLNGHKWYTTGADGASFAIAMMVTNPNANPALKTSMFIVPCDNPGFNLIRNISIMGETGSDYNSHGEVMFQSCRIPKENLLGKEGHGFRLAQERLGPGRIHHCMRWLGICNRSFDLMCERANERIITVDGKTLADKEAVQYWVAESKAEIQAARLMTLKAAWTIDNEGMNKAREEVAMIKFTVANTMQRVIDRALQVHGGLGMSDDTILAYFYRHERAARIYDGADEVHKSSLGSRILKEYKNKLNKKK
ncbi:MAG: acyl-CoA dehydrogenase family protein [Leptospiraceae bacterium]|nr:acyl-CoA dehydrogenase family protein [Leptospiraceae bacterium]MCP5498629.1 acyl-CoA dehydrogenase family protein [Leptospiraceae bacterium]